MLAEACSSEQCEENLTANSAAARKFIEGMELSMVNQEHMRLFRSFYYYYYYYYYLSFSLSFNFKVFFGSLQLQKV